LLNINRFFCLSSTGLTCHGLVVVNAFVKETIENSPSGVLYLTMIYHLYTKWCEKVSQVAVPLAELETLLIATLGRPQAFKKRKGWQNLRFKGMYSNVELQGGESGEQQLQQPMNTTTTVSVKDEEGVISPGEVGATSWHQGQVIRLEESNAPWVLTDDFLEYSVVPLALDEFLANLDRYRLAFTQRPVERWLCARRFINVPCVCVADAQAIAEEAKHVYEIEGLKVEVRLLNGLNEIVTHTTRGEDILCGNEQCIQSGLVVFEDLRIMEVSSKHKKLHFRLHFSLTDGTTCFQSMVSEPMIIYGKVQTLQRRENKEPVMDEVNRELVVNMVSDASVYPGDDSAQAQTRGRALQSILPEALLIQPDVQLALQALHLTHTADLVASDGIRVCTFAQWTVLHPSLVETLPDIQEHKAAFDRIAMLLMEAHHPTYAIRIMKLRFRPPPSPPLKTGRLTPASALQPLCDMDGVLSATQYCESCQMFLCEECVANIHQINMSEHVRHPVPPKQIKEASGSGCVVAEAESVASEVNENKNENENENASVIPRWGAQNVGAFKLVVLQQPPCMWLCDRKLFPTVAVGVTGLNGEAVPEWKDVVLELVLLDGMLNPINYTTRGDDALRGNRETLHHGKGIFRDLKVMEVSSKHKQLCFRLQAHLIPSMGTSPILLDPLEIYGKRQTLQRHLKDELHRRNGQSSVINPFNSSVMAPALLDVTQKKSALFADLVSVNEANAKSAVSVLDNGHVSAMTLLPVGTLHSQLGTSHPVPNPLHHPLTLVEGKTLSLVAAPPIQTVAGLSAHFEDILFSSIFQVFSNFKTLNESAWAIKQHSGQSGPRDVRSLTLVEANLSNLDAMLVEAATMEAEEGEEEEGKEGKEGKVSSAMGETLYVVICDRMLCCGGEFLERWCQHALEEVREVAQLLRSIMRPLKELASQPPDLTQLEDINLFAGSKLNWNLPAAVPVSFLTMTLKGDCSMQIAGIMSHKMKLFLLQNSRIHFTQCSLYMVDVSLMDRCSCQISSPVEQGLTIFGDETSKLECSHLVKCRVEEKSDSKMKEKVLTVVTAPSAVDVGVSSNVNVASLPFGME
jgi:hypothetical protein